jgi:anti-anti-sigma regulatory factor
MNAMDAAVGGGALEPKLHIDKIADGAVTCLKLSGTIDESFEGKRLGTTVRAGTLVLDLADVRKISSFGIREWVDFVGTVGERVTALYFVECAPKIVDQLNMVMNFAGKGHVLSFYAPYRCDYCDVERRVLLQVDRDRDAIRGGKPPERPCESCGNPSYFDEDPATFFSYVAGQAPFEVDGEVAAFLATKLSYTVADGARRLRAEKHIEGRMTHLRLAGDLDAGFPTAKVAEGLEGVVVVDLGGVAKIDPAGAAAWRGFLAAIGGTCEAVWLVACPPTFLERLARAEDLGRARVVSFAMPYACAKCAATAARTIDVDEHFDVLKFATAPEQRCPDCGGSTTCAASEALLAHLGALPRPEVPAEVRAFIAGEKKRKAAAPAPASAAPVAATRVGFAPILVAAALAALVAAGVVVGWTLLRDRGAAIAGGPVGRLLARSGEARPAWIGASATSYGSCGDAPGGAAVCVGISSYAATPEDARREASEAALEAAAWRASASIGDPTWKRLVAAAAAPARERALAETGGAHARDGRRAVVTALRQTGARLPAQVAADYWERYEAAPGSADTRTLAFARYDLSAADLAALAQPYGAVEKADGLAATTLFPGLAWRDPALRAGAVLLAVEGGPLRAAGLGPGDAILEVEGKPASDAAAVLAAIAAASARLAETGGTLHLVVKSGDAPPRDFAVPVPRGRASSAPARAHDDGRAPGRDPGPAPTGVNIWDRTGGGNARDNPNE